MIIFDIEHLNYPCRAHVSLSHTGEKGIAAQIVKSVNVELARNEFVKEVFGIFVRKNLYGNG